MQKREIKAEIGQAREENSWACALKRSHDTQLKAVMAMTQLGKTSMKFSRAIYLRWR